MKRPYDFIYFIGDSFTYAIGQADDLLSEINVNNRFSQLVADHYKLEHVNHAVAGTNNQYIARTLQDNMIEYSLQDKNPLVVVSYTDSARQEVWDNAKNVAKSASQDDSWYKDWLVDGFDWEHFNKIAQYHINSSRFLLKYLEFDFVEIFTTKDGKSINKTLEQTLVEIAGEKGLFTSVTHTGLGHLNLLGNKIVADTLINKIDELYG
jgi:hypothetical protein